MSFESFFLIFVKVFHWRNIVPMIQLSCILSFTALLQAEEPAGLELRFPSTTLTLEHMWTFRKSDGLVPPDPGVVFCIGRIRQDPGARRLAIAEESVFSQDGLKRLLNSGLTQNDPRVLYEGHAPPRDACFHRQDLDGDKIDEVLLTGRGGAGGTCMLNVFRVIDGKVELLFSDSSRFGFVIFDANDNGEFQIANPGFEFVIGPKEVLQPKEFKIFSLRNNKFNTSDTMTAIVFRRHLSTLVERSGTPLPQLHNAPILRVFDSNSEK